MQNYQKKYIIQQLDKSERVEIDREIFTLNKLSLSILGAVTQSLYNMDDVSIKATLGEFMQNENIKAVQIIDILLGKTFINAYNDSNSDNVITINITEQLPAKFTQLQFIEYNLVNNEDIIGLIKVYYNNQTIIESISKQKKIDLKNFNSQAQLASESLNILIIKQIIIFILGVSIITVIITHLLLKFVNKPLKKLSLGLEDFFLFLQGKKDSICDIDIYSHDEFGQMASSLNENIEVSAKLHENIRELNSSLEKKVQLRTQELAEINNQVIGFISFSPIFLKSDTEISVYILSPIAVSPEHQKQGIGSNLVDAGINMLTKDGVNVLLVYGDPSYYGRFGFKKEIGRSFVPPYPLQYPFGWTGMMLNETPIINTSIKFECVTALSKPELW